MLDPGVEYPYLRIRGDRKVGEDFLIAIDMNEMVFYQMRKFPDREFRTGVPQIHFLRFGRDLPILWSVMIYRRVAVGSVHSLAQVLHWS